MPHIWYRCASDGREPERYTLQVPFQFGPTHVLKNDEEYQAFSFGGLTMDVFENQGIHLLRVTGFRTHAEATAFLPRLHGSLLRLTVMKRLSIRPSLALQVPKMQKPPIDVLDCPDLGGLLKHKRWTHLDGWVDPTPAVIIPEHLSLVECGVGSVKAILGMSVSNFVQILLEGLEIPLVANIPANVRLTLAINLYAASLSDVTSSARVIGLFTALEALLQPQAVQPAVRVHIDKFIQELESSRDLQNESNEQRAEFDRLRSRLADLRNESVSQRLRQLVISQAEALGETQEETARNIKAAYIARSKLLHEGRSDIDSIRFAESWLKSAVPKILETLIVRVCASET